MTCPNDTDHDGDCHLCHRLSTGCFMRGTTPAGVGWQAVQVMPTAPATG